MRFRPPKSDRGVESICRFGERLSRQRGTYVGHFSFKGENGYVKFDLHRAKGSIVTPAGRCPRRHLTHAEVEKLIESLFEPISGLFAGSREGVATTSVLGLERKSGTRSSPRTKKPTARWRSFGCVRQRWQRQADPCQRSGHRGIPLAPASVPRHRPLPRRARWHHDLDRAALDQLPRSPQVPAYRSQL